MQQAFTEQRALWWEPTPTRQCYYATDYNTDGYRRYWARSDARPYIYIQTSRIGPVTVPWTDAYIMCAAHYHVSPTPSGHGYWCWGRQEVVPLLPSHPYTASSSIHTNNISWFFSNVRTATSSLPPQPRVRLVHIYINHAVERRIAVGETGARGHKQSRPPPTRARADRLRCESSSDEDGWPDYFEFTRCVALLPGWCWPAFPLKYCRRETRSFVHRLWSTPQKQPSHSCYALWTDKRVPMILWGMLCPVVYLVGLVQQLIVLSYPVYSSPTSMANGWFCLMQSAPSD